MDQGLCFEVMNALLDGLARTAAGWAEPAGLGPKIRALKALLRKRAVRASARGPQPDLFDDEFAEVQRFDDLSFEITLALAQLLSPHRTIEPAQLSAVLRAPTRADARGITGIVGPRREALGWSLFTLFGADPRLQPALRRLASAGICTVGQLIDAGEVEAYRLARADLAVWLDIRARLSKAGLAFRLPGQSVRARPPLRRLPAASSAGAS